MARFQGARCIRRGLHAGSLLLALQCTPLSDFEVHGCRTHADCDTLGSSVLRCEESRCIEGCADNAHCESIDPRSPLCEGSGGRCVGLSSAGGECHASAGYDPTTLGSGNLSQLIVIGMLAPTLRSSEWLSVQLAVDELNLLGGLPGRFAARPVVAVLCDSSTRQLLEASIEHLANALHTNAILAPVDDDALRALVERPSTKGAALFLSVNGIDPWNGAAPDNARALYLGASYGDALPAYPLVLQSAVDSLLRRGKSAEELRIASLISDTDEDANLAAAVRSASVIAGESFDRLELDYQAATFRLDGNEWPVDDIVGYAPDLILVFAGGSSLASPYRSRAEIVGALEARAADSAWQPLYLISPRTGRDAGLARLAQASPSFRSRAVSLSADRPMDELVSASIAGRFQRAFPLALGPDLSYAPAPDVYAAAYYLAYAAAAAPDGARGAAGIAAGLARITDADAERVDIGPGAGFSRAVELLGAGAAFNLYGTTGAADFDASTGARTGATHARCWLEDGTLRERARLGSGPAAGLELVSLDCAEEVFDALED